MEATRPNGRTDWVTVTETRRAGNNRLVEEIDYLPLRGGRLYRSRLFDADEQVVSSTLCFAPVGPQR